MSIASLQHLHTVTTGLNKPIAALTEHCEACILTKAVRVVNRKGSEHAKAPLLRVHMDFWGPYSVPTPEGEVYMLTITDDYTRKSWVFLTKLRKHLKAIFLQWKATVELETGLKLQSVRLDNA